MVTQHLKHQLVSYLHVLFFPTSGRLFYTGNYPPSWIPDQAKILTTYVVALSLGSSKNFH